MAQSLFKPVPRNKLATKAQSFPRKSSNTASPMTVRHTRDFTWNRGCSSKFPPLTHGDQIPHPLEDSDNQIPSSPGWQRFQMPGVCPGAGGGCWSFDLTDTLVRGKLNLWKKAGKSGILKVHFYSSTTFFKGFTVVSPTSCSLYTS